MFRILSCKKNAAENSLYAFMTEEVNKTTQFVEFETIEEVDIFVEELLNDKNMRKSDIMVVEVHPFLVSTDLA